MSEINFVVEGPFAVGQEISAAPDVELLRRC